MSGRGSEGRSGDSALARLLRRAAPLTQAQDQAGAWQRSCARLTPEQQAAPLSPAAV